MNRTKLIVAGIAVAALAAAAGFTYLLDSLERGQTAAAAIAQNSALAPAASHGAPFSRNVRVENDVQIIEIRAKGGYTPELTQAKAGVPTVIRIVTSDTFDCSSYVSIPSLKFGKRLPLSGPTDVPVKAQAAGATLTALCGMAMYRFDIEFHS